VEDLAVPDHPTRQSDAAAVRADAPAMPAIPSGPLGRYPYLIIPDGQRHSLGWQNTRKDGPSFVVARIGIMGNDKVLDRFPLTEDGWASA